MRFAPLRGGARLGRLVSFASFATALVVVTLVLVAVATSWASTSRTAQLAGCGGVVSTGPANWRHDYRPPLAVGDSTMLLALPELAREGFSANAHGCRQYPEALALLSTLLHAHELPRVVVIALGANGEVNDGDITQALQILGRERLLVLVTPRELGGGAGSDAALVRAEGRRHPQRVRVLDWVSYSARHPQWFEGDGLHLTPSGSAALAHLIGLAGPLAAPPRAVPVPSCPVAPPTAAGATAPLSGLAVTPRGGVLHADGRLARVRLMLGNTDSVAVTGVAELREQAPGAPLIAAACFSVPAGGSAGVSLRLSREGLADLRLRHGYRVQLELLPSALGGSGGEAPTVGYALR